MQKPLRVGLIGVAHNHVWHILDFLQESDLGILAAASIEDNPDLEERRQRIKQEYGLENIYTDYREMLDQEDIDVVFSYTDHLLRAPTTVFAASKGLPVMVEKPMAYNLEDAEMMLQAVEENDVKLMVNWPTMWSPAYRKAFKLVEQGAIGDLFQVRGRFGHSGPHKDDFGEFYDFVWMGKAAAGGAYTDFCGYGAALTVQMMGMPVKVFGLAANFVKPFLEGPDNGILVMMYDNGVATIEGTWTQTGRLPGGPMLFGTEGSISLGETLMLYTKDNLNGAPVAVDPLPAGEGNPVEYFLTRVTQDIPIEGLCNPKLSRDVQEVLEAGLMSSQSEKVVELPLHRG